MTKKARSQKRGRSKTRRSARTSTARVKAPQRSMAATLASLRQHVRRSALQAGAAFAALAIALSAGEADARPAAGDRGSNSNSAVMDRQPPGYEAKGVPLGAFRAFPTFTAEASYTDNVFATETNTQSDIIYIARPNLDIQSNWSRHSLRLNAGLTRSFHTDFPKDDITTTSVSLDGALDVRYGTRFGGSVFYQDAAEGRASPNSPTAAIKPVEFTTSGVTAFATQTFNRIRISGTASRQEFDYEDAITATGVILDQDDRDRTETRGSARVEFGVTPDMAVLAEVRLDDREYEFRPADPALSRDSNGRAFLAGVNFDVTRLVRGQIAAGYFTQDYDASVNDSEGLAVDVSFQWFPTQLTTVNINASRRADDTGVVGAASVLQTDGGVRVDHELRRNIILSAGVNRAQREFQGIDREDEVWGGVVEARWQLNPRVALSAGYAREEQDSSGVRRDRNFEVNRGFAALTLRL